MVDGEYPSFFSPFKEGYLSFSEFSPNWNEEMTIKDGGISDKDMENSSFYVLVNILHFLSFSSCIFFIFCLFHPMKNEEMAMEWWKVVRLWYGYLSFSVLLNIIHFLSISSCKHLILCLCISRVKCVGIPRVFQHERCWRT